MLWEIEVFAKGGAKGDLESPRVLAEYALLAGRPFPGPLTLHTSRGYVVEGELSADDANRVMNELLLDAVSEDGVCKPIPPDDGSQGRLAWTVLLKPGVTDPVAESVLNTARDLGLDLEGVQTFRR